MWWRKLMCFLGWHKKPVKYVSEIKPIIDIPEKFIGYSRWGYPGYWELWHCAECFQSIWERIDNKIEKEK